MNIFIEPWFMLLQFIRPRQFLADGFGILTDVLPSLVSVLGIIFKFSKATNLFETLIWNCFLTSNSLSYPRLNLSTSNVCVACFLATNLSLTFGNTRQWSVSHSVPVKYRTSRILECNLLSINMWSIWLWVFTLGEVQVCLWMFGWGNILIVCCDNCTPHKILFGWSNGEEWDKKDI